MSEKYGFVYLWYDRKHKRYYIGCHWGAVEDKYICSSNWMRDAYKRRPEDFKRRILVTSIQNRTVLLETEYKFLQMIKDEELGNRYYNLSKKHFGHWSTNENKKLKLKEKISIATKEAMQRPEVRQKYEDGLKTRNQIQSEETKQKRSKALIGKRKGCDNTKAVEASVAARKGKCLSVEHVLKLKEVTHFNTINNIKTKCTYCDFIGNKGNLARYHNEKCKQKC